MATTIYKRLDSDQVQYLVNLIFTKLKGSPLSANTTYTLIQDSDNGRKFKLNGSDGSSVSLTIPETIVDGALSAESENPVKNKVVNAALEEKAPLDSPALTGVPTAPTATAGSNTAQIATTAYVKNELEQAIAGVTQFRFSVVESLPSTGEVGIIYLIKHIHSDSGDAYDEYIWLDTTKTFEKIGNTDVDLSGYVQSSEMKAMSNTEVQTAVEAAYIEAFG
jgi:hypothetical protein